MQLVKVQYQNQIFAGVLVGDLVHLDEQSATSPTPILDFLDSDNLLDKLTHIAANNPAVPCETVKLLAPIDRQEVWAAGVTYIRSKSARMEESETAASCYDRVYEADRPEIFFKATPIESSDREEIYASALTLSGTFQSLKLRSRLTHEKKSLGSLSETT